jgi:hypothetical protein
MISFNKKGAVFHFLLFIVLAALAIFFMYTRLGVVKSDVKGDWQVDFLEKNFLESQKVILLNSQKATFRAYNTIDFLSQNGGFDKKSECKNFLDFNYWIFNDRACFPNALDNANKLVRNDLVVILNGVNEAKFKDDKLIVDVDKQTIESDIAVYTFDPSMFLDLSYDFMDYDDLKIQVIRVHKECKESDDKVECANKLFNNWGGCDGQLFDFQNEKVGLYCVKSPNDYYISLNENNNVVTKLVEYRFAIGFDSEKKELE